MAMDAQVEASIDGLQYRRVEAGTVTENMAELRDAASRYTTALGVLCPAGHERSIALTHVETSLMFGIKALVLDQPHAED